MRPPTRISTHSYNPYEELAQLADPEPDSILPPGRPPRLPPVRAIPSDDEPEHWAPPNHRGKSRLAAVPITLKFIVAVVVAGTLFVLCDRLALIYAEEKAEEGIQDSLGLAAQPDVDINGFPFLTQLARNRVDHADLDLPDLPADKVSIAEVHIAARDIRLVGDLPTSVQGAFVARMQGDVLLSFDDLNRELGASRLEFTSSGPDAVHIAGSLPVAGRTVTVAAQARVGKNGDRAVSTTLENIRLDVPRLFTYRPGKDPDHAGLRLHPEAAGRISRETARIKALFNLPAVVERLGIPQSHMDRALRSEKELHRLTGSPRFLQSLTKVNLIDLVVDHPVILETVGIDPDLVGALLQLRLPELADRFSLSVALPKTVPGDVRLRDIVVERDGVRVDLTGSGLSLGAALSPERPRTR
ncbi:DUF2993 domain-containing protein [Streptomyces sp. NPDC096176]|uniref:LmeA family phospholipid-binding protein n=1 Tax=Streptomyces sp. NPDC096176 TaxID=3366079 RepID=UPI0038165DB6